MSDGLKLISAVIATGSSVALHEVDREMLLDNERVAYEFTRRHLRTYRELPAAQTIQEETGVRLPVATESLQYYLDQVHDRFEYNQIRDRFATLREALTTRQMRQVADSVGEMSRVIRRRRRGASHTGEALQMDEAGRMVVERLRQVQGTGGISGIITDWPLFDYITGGYQNSDLITWVGRMGLGKTYILLRQAQKAHAAGHSVLFVTTEMGIEPIARRYAALTLGINPTFMKNGAVSTHMQRRISRLYRDMVGAERFKIFAVGMNAKVDAITALCQEYGPDIVFIDGVYLLRPTELSRSANRTEKVSAVYDELRAVNLELARPFVVSTQFNRQAGKSGKEGSLENIGYSDAIGTHSSHVIALKDGPTDNPRESRTFDFLKGREGESGTVAINFKFAPLNMDEMTQEETEEEVGVTSESVQWMGLRRR